MSGRSTLQRAMADVPNIKHGLSCFNRSYGKLLNCECDKLIPVFSESVLPGDIVDLKMNSVQRILDIQHPPFDILKSKFYFFYIPNRLVFQRWPEFIGAVDSSYYDEDNPFTPPVHPYIMVKPALHSIYDYFEEPIREEDGGNVVQPIKLNALKFRGYNLVYNQWFKQDELMSPVQVKKGEGEDSADIYDLQYANKDLDLFTSCLPSAQRGEPVSFNLAGQADVYQVADKSDVLGNRDELQFSRMINVEHEYYSSPSSLVLSNMISPDLFQDNSFAYVSTPVVSLSNQKVDKESWKGSQSLLSNVLSKSYATLLNDVKVCGPIHTDKIYYPSPRLSSSEPAVDLSQFDISSIPSSTTTSVSSMANTLYLAKDQPIGKIDVSNLKVDMSSLKSITVNDIRDAVLRQQKQEILQRTGSGRYNEFVYAFWSVDMGDSRLQRAELLGMFEKIWNFNTTMQTSPSSEGQDGYLGDMASNGVLAFADQYCFRKSFPEYGFILGLMSIKGELNYSQGLPQSDLTFEQEDYYLPLFSHSGEIPIYSKQIFCTGEGGIDPETGLGVGDDSIFGYNEYGSNERYRPSAVCGDFRPLVVEGTPVVNLSSWQMSQYYEDRPVLSEEFLKSHTPVDRIVRQSANDYHFMCDIYYKFKHYRQVPVYSTPGLTRI